ncbi:hypothetical protein JX265_003064 [Neoarthrinium moseri]|uniref:Beta-mannosidase B n=1 Tax=Neoarthrinium moseri TaxID=1658444 RepID=A0A9P9WTK9_9PEZI|nr:hypothetical protein JX265_003064 [Neoarthrinium moseri]
MGEFMNGSRASTRVELKDGWMLKQAGDESENAWLPVQAVPTDVYRELLANKKIADPFEDLNELSVRWVADQDWVYKKHFGVDLQAVSPGARLDLVFEGLDTFATVYLNGKEILTSENMFLSHRVNVNDHCRSDNVLEIVFDSARLRGQKLLEEHSHEHRFIARQTEDGRIPVRKAQYHWGWDWGPILVGTSGPWKPVYIDCYVARIDDIWVESQFSDDLKDCSGYIHGNTAGDLNGAKVSISLTYGGEQVFRTECVVGTDGSIKCPFAISSVKLWCPQPYGAPLRYRLDAALYRDGTVVDEKSKMIGFRKVELVQTPDASGKSFYFRINGTDIFAGGSCWIPGSSYLSELSKEKYYDWIELLQRGNQNMVRVWGGGIYEDDAFYDACDELGVLVWQDFCFACGNYPAYPSFMQSFELEARQNIQRLRSHPSLVIWAGSNEDYQVQERYKLHYDYSDKDPQSWLKSNFPARYYYEYLLPKVVQEEHPGAAYHPTSPWGDGKDTADPTVGDIHQWNIWHGTMEKYQYADSLGGRFVSEFGMEAYPHLETILSAVTKPEQQYPGSMTMDFHNKAIGHERRLVSYVAENFQLKTDLPSFTHLTQMVQAEAMSYAYKHWRRAWGTHTGTQGQPIERKCGGILVWQFNDCWPTMSWAIVDYYGIRKPAYYSISRALKPITIAVSRTVRDWSKKKMNEMLELGQVDPTTEAREGTVYNVWIANSTGVVAASEVKVEVRFVSIKTGSSVLPTQGRAVQMDTNSTTDVWKDQVGPLNADLCDPTKPFDLDKYDPYIIHATLYLQGIRTSTDTAWPEPFKFLDFADRGLKFKKSGDKATQVIITADKPVKGLVFEETRVMRLNDNNFDIVPGEDVLVEVEGVPLNELRYTYVGAPVGSIKIDFT